MIGLLDPCLFDHVAGESAQEWTARLSAVVHACRIHAIRLQGTLTYDKALWERATVPPAFPRTDLEARQARAVLAELRKLWERPRVQPIAPEISEVQEQGLRELFGHVPPECGWLKKMGDALLSACASGQPVCLFVRDVAGHNVRVHEHEGTRLSETLVWQVTLRAADAAETWQIPCVRNSRHIAVPWTARMDDRLPAAADSGKYPFCPPDDWCAEATTVFRTVQSKPAWQDRRGNGWAWQRYGSGTPTHGVAGHWDVLLCTADSSRFDIEALNIVPWPSKLQGKQPGDIDHVPKAAQTRFRNDGWQCA